MAQETDSDYKQWDEIGENENDSTNTDSPFPPNCPLPLSDSESSPVGVNTLNPNLLMTPLTDDGFLKAATATIAEPKPASQPSTPKTKKSSSHTKAKKLRKKTLLFNSPKVTEYKIRVAKLEREVSFFNTYIEEVKDKCRVEILDTCERTKNGLTVLFKQHIDEHSSYIESLLNRIDYLENSEKSLVKQVVPSLKGRIAVLEKEKKELSVKVNTLEIQNREFKNKLENTAQDIDDCALNDSDESDHRHTPEYADSLRSSSGHEDHEPSAVNTSHAGSVSVGCDSSEDTPSTPARENKETNPKHASLTVPKQNPVHEASSGNPSPRDNNRLTRGESPSRNSQSNVGNNDTKPDVQRNLNFVMNEGTTHVLIGDSTIRGINPQRSTPMSAKWSKTCIGGLKTMEIPTLLSGSHNYPEVGEVYLHTGVSDSKSGPLSTKTCSDTLKHLMYKFSAAKINVSSIIPTKGRDSLGENVKETNTNMKIACSKLNINFINNEIVFLSRNGAPKLALYKDKIHPSPKGTAVLASNIFGNPQHESRPNTQNNIFDSNQSIPNTVNNQDLNPPSIHLTNHYPPLPSFSSQIRDNPNRTQNPSQIQNLDRQSQETNARLFPQNGHYDTWSHTLPPPIKMEPLNYSQAPFRELHPQTNYTPFVPHQPNFQIPPYQYHPIPFHPLSRPYFSQPPHQALNYQPMSVY